MKYAGTEYIPPDDRVICRQLPAETHTAFGLEIPETARERPLRAKVLAVGRGVEHPATGKRIPLGEYIDLREDYDDEGAFAGDAWYVCELEAGDEVVIPRYGGTEIEAEDGETVISILASEILAVVT